MAMQTLVFQNTTFDVTDRNGQPWIRGYQIGTALGYTNQPDAAVRKIYDRNADEFTASMTALVKLPTAGGEQETRIFSLRGCHLIGMLSRTKIAKAFRVWVLNILDKETKPTIEPAPYELTPYVQNRSDILSKAQADILRDMLETAAHKLPLENQGGYLIKAWSKMKAHFKVGYREIPQGEFTEAVSLLARYVATGTLTAPANDKLQLGFDHSEEGAALAQLAMHSMIGKDFLLRVCAMPDGRAFHSVQPILDSAFLISMKDIPQLLAKSGLVAVKKSALDALALLAA